LFPSTGRHLLKVKIVFCHVIWGIWTWVTHEMNGCEKLVDIVSPISAINECEMALTCYA
jgi:hypothetical protein